MRYVTQKDIEEINEKVRELQKNCFTTWKDIEKVCGWSATTIKKYYDEKWYPGKYFQKPIEKEAISKELEYPGIYMLAQQVLINGEIINLIKVGKSTNLKKRLSQYNGMNPTVKIIDTKRCYNNKEDYWEVIYHMTLGTKNKRYGNTEWFICNEEQFNYWINKKLTLGDKNE